ncbi:hypothetical protein [Raoultella ornithinolytica]|uniref:hypothetical protein n=1 Tax=Raoultella ornithinolytica TaxID=54291 RepID=UPI001F34D9E1|nr:hypothetical protein [Raoultella ornithinolytica]
MTPPDDDDDAADAIECGWTATPLYRHAQQPVVPRVTCWSCRNQVEISAIGDCDGYCPECDAPIDLGEEPYTSEQPVPVVPEKATVGEMPFLGASEGAYVRGWNDCRAAMLQAGNCRENANSSTNNCREIAETSTNSPVIGIDPASGRDCSVEVRYVAPPGYVMVPMRLTAENGAKGVLSGEFSETQFVNCPECFGDDECETCDGSGRIEIKVPVSWTTIKEIWIKGVEHFAAAPQENN